MGNLIGLIRCIWTKTGTLPSFTPPTTNQVNVYIDASNAIIDEAGWSKPQRQAVFLAPLYPTAYK